MLARDHKEVLSEKMQVAQLVKILPNALQERVNEHLDRQTTYKDVHANIINLVQSSSKYNLNDAMDCSAVDDYDDEFYDDTAVNALAKGQCGRCGGMGHYARDCATLATRVRAEAKQGRCRDLEMLRSRARMVLCVPIVIGPATPKTLAGISIRI